MILVQNYVRNKPLAPIRINRAERMALDMQKTLFQQLEFVGLISLVKEEFGQKAPSILAAMTLSKMTFVLDPYLSNHKRLIFFADDVVDDRLQTESEEFLERLRFRPVTSVDTAEGTKFNMSNIDLFLYTKEQPEVAVIVTLFDPEEENTL